MSFMFWKTVKAHSQVKLRKKNIKNFRQKQRNKNRVNFREKEVSKRRENEREKSERGRVRQIKKNERDR